MEFDVPILARPSSRSNEGRAVGGAARRDRPGWAARQGKQRGARRGDPSPLADARLRRG